MASFGDKNYRAKYILSLEQQAKTSDAMVEALKENAELEKLGLPNNPKPQTSQVDERLSADDLRIKSIEKLQTILPARVAVDVALRLQDMGELDLLNSYFNTFKEETKGQEITTTPVFLASWDKFKTLASENKIKGILAGINHENTIIRDFITKLDYGINQFKLFITRAEKGENIPENAVGMIDELSSQYYNSVIPQIEETKDTYSKNIINQKIATLNGLASKLNMLGAYLSQANQERIDAIDRAHTNRIELENEEKQINANNAFRQRIGNLDKKYQTQLNIRNKALLNQSIEDQLERKYNEPEIIPKLKEDEDRLSSVLKSTVRGAAKFKFNRVKEPEEDIRQTSINKATRQIQSAEDTEFQQRFSKLFEKELGKSREPIENGDEKKYEEHHAIQTIRQRPWQYINVNSGPEYNNGLNAFKEVFFNKDLGDAVSPNELPNIINNLEHYVKPYGLSSKNGLVRDKLDYILNERVNGRDIDQTYLNRIQQSGRKEFAKIKDDLKNTEAERKEKGVERYQARKRELGPYGNGLAKEMIIRGEIAAGNNSPLLLRMLKKLK